LTERNANDNIPSYYHPPVSCRSLVDRRGSLGSCKPQLMGKYIRETPDPQHLNNIAYCELRLYNVRQDVDLAECLHMMRRANFNFACVLYIRQFSRSTSKLKKDGRGTYRCPDHTPLRHGIFLSCKFSIFLHPHYD
jgi:hypothetical protein